MEKSNKQLDFKVLVAVASKTGVLVDLHFGHATEFYIYETDGVCADFVEKRSVDKFCTGDEDCGEAKIENTIKTISDCSYILVLRIGAWPMQLLEENGITPIISFDRIEDAVISAVNS